MRKTHKNQSKKGRTGGGSGFAFCLFPSVSSDVELDSETVVFSRALERSLDSKAPLLLEWLFNGGGRFCNCCARGEGAGINGIEGAVSNIDTAEVEEEVAAPIDPLRSLVWPE